MNMKRSQHHNTALILAAALALGILPSPATAFSVLPVSMMPDIKSERPEAAVSPEGDADDKRDSTHAMENDVPRSVRFDDPYWIAPGSLMAMVASWTDDVSLMDAQGLDPVVDVKASAAEEHLECNLPARFAGRRGLAQPMDNPYNEEWLDHLRSNYLVQLTIGADSPQFSDGQPVEEDMLIKSAIE